MTNESKIVEAKKRRTEGNTERKCKNCKKIILNCIDYFICHEGCEDFHILLFPSHFNFSFHKFEFVNSRVNSTLIFILFIHIDMN